MGRGNDEEVILSPEARRSDDRVRQELLRRGINQEEDPEAEISSLDGNPTDDKASASGVSEMSILKDLGYSEEEIKDLLDKKREEEKRDADALGAEEARRRQVAGNRQSGALATMGGEVRNPQGEIIFQAEDQSISDAELLNEFLHAAHHDNNLEAKGADFSGANFSGFNADAYLSPKGINFSGANFSGSDLSQVDFTDCDFSGAIFWGADCQYANFMECSLDKAFFNQANLQSSDFVNCQARGASFYEADLREARATSSDFSGSDFSKSKMAKINLSTRYDDAEANKLQNCEFDNTDLTEANLSGADFWKSYFSESKLNGVVARGAVFSDCRIKKSSLKKADLTEADLSGASLLDIDGRKAILDYAHCLGVKISGDLSYGSLQGVRLEDSNVIEVNFSGSNLMKATLHGTNVERADFDGANLLFTDFSRAVDVSYAYFRDTIYESVDKKEIAMRSAKSWRP